MSTYVLLDFILFLLGRVLDWGRIVCKSIWKSIGFKSTGNLTGLQDSNVHDSAYLHVEDELYWRSTEDLINVRRHDVIFKTVMYNYKNIRPESPTEKKIAFPGSSPYSPIFLSLLLVSIIRTFVLSSYKRQDAFVRSSGQRIRTLLKENVCDGYSAFLLWKLKKRYFRFK